MDRFKVDIKKDALVGGMDEDKPSICSICVTVNTSMEQPMVTNCGHSFCWPCIYLVSI